MTTQTYPEVSRETDVVPVLQRIQQMRQDDVNDFNNLKNRFVMGRSVNRIPANSADVVPTDKVGDVSYALNGATMYVLVSASGTPAWRSVALGTF